MRRVVTLIILGCFALAGWPRAEAAPAGSNWPSLDADAALSNYNPTEKALTPGNVGKLQVRWTAATASVSYPVVANGRVYVPFQAGSKIHVRALDAASGKVVATYPKDAAGGLLFTGTSLYLAGHVLQAVDPATGNKLTQINGSGPGGGRFVYPQDDGKVIVAGYVNSGSGSLYTVDPASNQVLQKLPSSSAFGTLAGGHVLTTAGVGSAVYDEVSGKAVAHPAYLGSYWFAGSVLSYTVASVKRQKARLYAFDAPGHRAWSRVVGPDLATWSSDWPHAVGPNVLYVDVRSTQPAVQALDALSGHVLWTHHVDNVLSITLADNMVFVLTSFLGTGLGLQVLNANTGALITGKTLTGNYFGFADLHNALMVADGMVFIRAIYNSSDPVLIALAPRKASG
jgi:hypothetical protein